MKSADNEKWEMERDRSRSRESFEKSGMLQLASLIKWSWVLFAAGPLVYLFYILIRDHLL